MQPSNFALIYAHVNASFSPLNQPNDSPVRHDTVVEQHAAHDARHLANDAVLPDDGALDCRALLHARRAADHRVGRDLRLLVDERAVLRIGRERVCRLAEELRGHHRLVVQGNEAEGGGLTKRFSSRYAWRLFARDAKPAEERCATNPTRRLGSTDSSSSSSTGEGTTERRCSSPSSEPAADRRTCCLRDGVCSVECLSASAWERLFVTGLSTVHDPDELYIHKYRLA